MIFCYWFESNDQQVRGFELPNRVFGRLNRGDLELMGQLLSSNVTFLVVKELDVPLSCDISGFPSFDLDEAKTDGVFEEALLDECLAFNRQINFSKVS